MNHIREICILLLLVLLSISSGEVVLPNTGLTISANFAVNDAMDAWDTPAVICSTETGCVDVVFVVDTSGSMSGIISEFYTEIGEFAYTLESEGYDGAFGIVTFVDASNFPAGDTLFHDPDNFAEQVGHLNGAEGGWENPIDASYEAINGYFFPSPDTCKKVIVCITDETEEGSSHSVADLVSLAFSVPETVRVYLVSPSGHPMESACTATGGQWFDIDVYSMDEVLDAIADNVAEFTAVTITIHNNTGGDISDMTVEINPLSCIDLDYPPDSIQNTGPVADGDSVIVNWEITEVPFCSGCEDCFTITIDAGGYTDTVIGCLFVEDCDCPGINANVIRPRHCGQYTACDGVTFQFDGCFSVNPNTIIVYMGGEYISYPDPRLSFNAADQTLIFTPSPPWTDGLSIDFYIADAQDITGCELRYSQHCSVIIDKSPPVFDEGPNWSPPCETTIDDATIIHFDACVHDEGIGMTMLDGGLDLAEMTAENLFSVFFAIYLEINGGIFGGDSLFEIPGIPGLPGLGYDFVLQESHWEIGIPPPCVCGTLVASAMNFYDGFPLANFHIIRRYCNTTPDLCGGCPDCGDCDWQVQFDILAGDIRALVGMPSTLELCFHFTDMIYEEDCGPNDTVVCCEWYFDGCAAPDPFTLISPLDGYTADCSVFVEFVWNSAGGTPPMYYDLYVDGSPVAIDFTDTTFTYGWVYNPSMSTMVLQWYVYAHNDCGNYTTSIWTINIEPCCAPALAWIGCPYPNCFEFTSCKPQPVTFAMQDTTGRAIDHNQVYFTITVFHPLGGSDVYPIDGSHSAVFWSGDTAVVNWPMVADGDSVEITLDSLFTTDGCLTVPSP